MGKMAYCPVILVSITLLLTACGGLTRYSAAPHSLDEETIPGGDKGMSDGSLLVSSIRKDIENYAYFLSHGGKAEHYYDIAAYYSNPQVKYKLDLSGTSMPGVPFLPLPTAKVLKTGGGDNEIYVAIQGVVENEDKVRYTLPAFDKKFALKRLEMTNNALSPQIFLIEKEPMDGTGWDGIYGWVNLLYPELVMSPERPCPTGSSIELRPYDAVATHTNGYHYSSEFWKKHKASYLSDPANVLHVDLTLTHIYLVPRSVSRTN